MFPSIHSSAYFSSPVSTLIRIGFVGPEYVLSIYLGACHRLALEASYLFGYFAMTTCHSLGPVIVESGWKSVNPADTFRVRQESLRPSASEENNS